MGRRLKVGLLVGAAAGVLAVARHRGAAPERHAAGGILIGNVDAYDRLARLLLAPLYRAIARDVARVAPASARVLEVGCGPGRLAIELAREHGLDVTGIDLDPSMIERAEVNARLVEATGPRVLGMRQPRFSVADVALLPFADASFDLVVSTFSMHHWAEVTGGLAEIARILRPDGRALVWDLRRGALPFHRDVPDPVEQMEGAPLRILSAAPWRWPWRFTLTTRLELTRAEPWPRYDRQDADGGSR